MSPAEKSAITFSSFELDIMLVLKLIIGVEEGVVVVVLLVLVDVLVVVELVVWPGMVVVV